MLAVYVESLEGSPDVGPNNEEVATWSAATVQAILENPDVVALGAEVLWYYNTTQPPLMRDFLISHNRRATILALKLRRSDGLQEGTHMSYVLDFMKGLCSSTPFARRYYVGVTGQPYLLVDSRDGIDTDEADVDMKCIPISVIILWLFLQRVSMLVFPAVTMPASLVISFALGFVVSAVMRVSTLAVVLMQAIVVAFNIDYSLFLLLRFLELKEQGLCLWHNIESVVTHTASESVLVSGVLVAMACFSVCLIGAEPLTAFGITAGMTVLVTVFVNCTLTPSILLCFGDVLSEPLTLPLSIQRFQRHFRARRQPESSLPEPLLEERIFRARAFDAELARQKQESSAWFKMARCTSRCPVLILVITVLAGMPFCMRLGQAFSQTTTDTFEMVPDSMQSVEAFQKVMRTFNPGQLLPFYLMVVAKPSIVTSSGQGCWSPECYAATQWLVSRLSMDPDLVDVSSSVLLGPTIVPLNLTRLMDQEPALVREACSLNGLSTVCEMVRDYMRRALPEVPKHINYWEADLILSTPIPSNPLPFSDALFPNVTSLLAQANEIQSAYRQLCEQSVSPDRRAMLTQVWLPYKPLSPRGDAFITRVANLLDDFESDPARRNSFTVHLYDAQATMLHDFNTMVEESMPSMLFALVLAATGLVSCVFKSLPIAFIMCVTIIYSAGVAHGVGYYLFQTDMFYDVLPILQDSGNGGIFYLIMPLLTSFMAAFAMDYDIFLLTRVMEIRQRGYTTRAATLKSVYEVMPVICGAAIIMLVVFGGLSTMDIMCFKQLAYCLVTALSVDAFVVPTLLVPAVMHICGRYAWFPGSSSRRGPTWREEGNKGLEHFEPPEAHDDSADATPVLDNSAELSPPVKRCRGVAIAAFLLVPCLCFVVHQNYFFQNLSADAHGMTVVSAGFHAPLDSFASSLRPSFDLHGVMNLTVNNPNYIPGSVSAAVVDVRYRPHDLRPGLSGLLPSSYHVATGYLTSSIVPVSVAARGSTVVPIEFDLSMEVFELVGMAPQLAAECSSSQGTFMLEFVVTTLRASVLDGIIPLNFDHSIDLETAVRCTAT
eukprot:TRINITY_DN60707_c0_g1_i1.p1 TRINITY_DN60707_c0_g1~~TRINITY_DN60707_c0_g1_i1.p1  ORF type:complete len:1155 (+),score=106.42 TRINITY_DN60707_c0_g1_i1:295-3465(+)